MLDIYSFGVLGFLVGVIALVVFVLRKDLGDEE